MRPLQIWLPTLNSRLSTAAARRDCERAMKVWNGETTVWLLPELERNVWWLEAPGRRVVAIPSERLERIDIYHVGMNGYVVGSSAGSRFPNHGVEGLLSGWLDYAALGSIDYYFPPKTVLFEVPCVSESAVTFREIELHPKPYGMIPIVRIEESSRTVVGCWPSKSVHCATVSPDAESEELFGPFDRADVEGIPMGVSLKDGQRILFWFSRWPDPLEPLIPNADGTDIFLGQALMAAIARQSTTDLAGAIIRARQDAGAYLFEGYTSREWAWFWPTCLCSGDDAVLFEAEEFRSKARTVAELFKNTTFRKAMAQAVYIRRAWGPLGLFWALLLEQLENHQIFSSCQRCQRIIEGKKGKRFCGREDNHQCYSNRRAADQRSSRARRK